MRPRSVVAAAAIALLAFAPTVASAHESAKANGVEVVIGWGDEPALAGEPNAVEIIVEDQDGDPVTGVKLSVEVGFGQKVMERRALEPVFGEPGHYDTAIVPTRPGTYTFRLTGRLAGKAVDRTFTSGENTFDDVSPAQDIQFPEPEPAAADLATANERTSQRVLALESRAKAAEDDASKATTIAWIAVGLGVLGVLSGLLGRRRKAA